MPIRHDHFSLSQIICDCKSGYERSDRLARTLKRHVVHVQHTHEIFDTLQLRKFEFLRLPKYVNFFFEPSKRVLNMEAPLKIKFW